MRGLPILLATLVILISVPMLLLFLEPSSFKQTAAAKWGYYSLLIAPVGAFACLLLLIISKPTIGSGRWACALLALGLPWLSFTIALAVAK